VTFWPGRRTNVEDEARYLGGASAVVVIEDRWWERVRDCRLYCYHLPPESFHLLDATAGYYVSEAAVAPVGVETIDDAIGALRRRGVDLRTVPNLWPFRGAVVASTLEFSIIRMRNALPRPLH
jgi:hypothetical protein